MYGTWVGSGTNPEVLNDGDTTVTQDDTSSGGCYAEFDAESD